MPKMGFLANADWTFQIKRLFVNFVINFWFLIIFIVIDNGNRQLVLIKTSKFSDEKLKSNLQWPYREFLIHTLIHWLEGLRHSTQRVVIFLWREGSSEGVGLSHLKHAIHHIVLTLYIIINCFSSFNCSESIKLLYNTHTHTHTHTHTEDRPTVLWWFLIFEDNHYENSYDCNQYNAD